MKTCALLTLVLFGNTHGELVGRWLFNEGSGTVYADSSSNGNDARIAGAQVWSTDTPNTGFSNPASLTLNGTTDFVNTSFQGIGGNAPRTVAFWIKISGAPTNHGIVAWGNSVENGAKWHIRLNSAANNGPLGAIRTETQGDFTIGTTALNDGQWHHVASVYPDGAGELGTVIHYIDGQAETAGGNGASIQAVNTSTVSAPVTVGRRNQGGVLGYFPGQIDDVRIYDRALTPQEVTDLSGASPTTAGLMMYLPMDEGSGSVINDVGTGDNDGSIAAPNPPVWSNDAPPSLSSSLLFSGNSDFLYTDYEGIGGSASRSVTFWFKTTLVSDNGILGWGNAGGAGLKWHARLNTSSLDGPVGALRVEIQDGRIVATTPVNDGQWHHGAIIFEEDGDPDITDVVFYLDGQLDPSTTFTSVPINTVNTGGPFAVTLGGRLQGAVGRGFTGNLADLRIFDSGLSQAEVMEIMTGGNPGESGPEITFINFTPGSPGSLTLTWNSRNGVTYRVESSSDLYSPWQEEADALESQGATTTRTIDIFPGNDRKLFFRVSEE